MYMYFLLILEKEKGLLTIFCTTFQETYFLKECVFRETVKNNSINTTENRTITNLSENCELNI